MKYIGLNSDYNEKECDSYFAFLHKIKYIDKKRDIHEENIKSDDDAYFVNVSKQEEENTVAKDYYNIDHDRFRFLPLLRKNIKDSKDRQRDVCVIFGSSGSGKSYLTDKIVQLYTAINKTKVYYISSKNMLIDSSFNENMYEQFIPFKQFISQFDTDSKLESFRIGQLYDNTLLVIDDITFDNKEEKILFWKIMKIILELKRINNLSLIYIIHQITDFVYTRDLFTEMTMYISFGMDLRNRANRVLDSYLKLTKYEQNYIANIKNSRWTCVYTRKKLVLSESSILMLK